MEAHAAIAPIEAEEDDFFDDVSVRDFLTSFNLEDIDALISDSAMLDENILPLCACAERRENVCFLDAAETARLTDRNAFIVVEVFE